MSLTKVTCEKDGFSSHYWHVSVKMGDRKMNYLFTDSQLQMANKRAIKLALEPKQTPTWWDKWTRAKQL